MGKSKMRSALQNNYATAKQQLTESKQQKQKTKLHGFYMMQGRQWNDTESNNISRL